jgi:HAD superfamily phosphoserine phosphatase-like hydrolase
VSVAADLEGTLTTGATWRGVGRHVGASIAPWRYRWFFARRVPSLAWALAGGEDRRAFQDRWMRDLLTFFRGETEHAFAAMAADVVARELWPQRRRDVVEAMRTHLRAGERLVLASGTYQPLLEAFAAKLSSEVDGPVAALGTAVEVVEGRLTGRLVGRINVGEVKAERVAAWLGASRLTAAYGDTVSDLPLLRLADAPVAVHPDAGLRSTAQRLGWHVLDA